MSQVNPELPENQNKPLWCVYGPDCFPSIICCRIRPDSEYGPIIWGYSVYRRVPGFRTLGEGLSKFTKEKGGALFFDNQDGALEHLKKITAPRIKE